MRVAAAESMPLLLECARVRGPEYLTQMWHFMCDALIKSIGTEPDSDVLSEIMHSFAKVSPRSRQLGTSVHILELTPSVIFPPRFSASS